MEKKRGGLRGFSHGTAEIYKINPKEIRIKDGWNVRIDFGNLPELKESIRESGLKNPIRVYMENGQPTLSDGNRRLKAILELIEEGEDFPVVPCISEPQHYTEENRIFDLILCNDGKPLDMLEMGMAFIRLLDRGYTQAEIAKKIGKTQAHISSCVQVATLPKPVQNAIVDGEIAASTALSVARESKTEEQAIETVKAAVADAKSNGKDKATTKNVEAVQSSSPAPVRFSISKAYDSFKEWLDENQIVLAEYPGYKVLKRLPEFLEGKLTIEEFETIVKGE